MFFTLSKIFWTLAQPLNAICLLLIAGGIVRIVFWEKGGKIMISAAIGFLLIFGVLPIGPTLTVWLERQYPIPQTLPEKIDGIIVLGGPFESYLTKETGRLTANDNIERMFCFTELSQKYPNAKLIYSGGAGDILNPDAMESEDARAYFKMVGFGRDVFYEEKSRNTYDNVFYSKEMISPQKGQNWIAVTSAYHIPRAIGVFEKLEWPVIPYGCDQRTDGTYANAIRRLPNVTTNFAMLNLAIKEITGSFIYYVTGKSTFILLSARVALPHDEIL